LLRRGFSSSNGSVRLSVIIIARQVGERWASSARHSAAPVVQPLRPYRKEPNDSRVVVPHYCRVWF
jgi:hypothetical protein